MFNFLNFFIFFSFLFDLFAWETKEIKKSVTMYGFILPSIVSSSKGVQSFSQSNLSAYTSAANPMLDSVQDKSRYSFQVAQSRFGIRAKYESLIQGDLEFDIIDFTKSSPTTQANPRVRRAVITLNIDENNKLLLGQDWDLFSPLAPHTYNLIGHYFESGDLGFMRHQLTFLHQCANSGPSKHQLGIALGLPTSNATSSDSTIELTGIPTLSLRYTVNKDAKNSYGISLIGTKIQESKTSTRKIKNYGLNAFNETTLFNDSLNLRSEIYWGRNLYNLGTLSLSYGSATSDAYEIGGWITGSHKIGENKSIFAGFGLAKITNEEKMLPAYTTSNGVSSLSNTGPGIKNNSTIRVGMDYTPLDQFKVFMELAVLETTHKLTTNDLKLHNPKTNAFIVNTGFKLDF